MVFEAFRALQGLKSSENASKTREMRVVSVESMVAHDAQESLCEALRDLAEERQVEEIRGQK